MADGGDERDALPAVIERELRTVESVEVALADVISEGFGDDLAPAIADQSLASGPEVSSARFAAWLSTKIAQWAAAPSA